ncbi:MAG: insulinase family protein [Planctomycetia bacterium]|nr:insulinase family protein [Planctomycetia bacterium]
MRRTVPLSAALSVALLAVVSASVGCHGARSRCCPTAGVASVATDAAGVPLVVTQLSRGTPVPEATPAPKTVVDEASGVSETVLGNGLTILVKPQPDNPMVTCMIWYAVGSRDESVGETGLSHYLEHMLFKGTEKLAPGEIDRLTQRNGGTNNASTRNDATEYHFSFPADRWEVALEIEADRMRNSNCPQGEFDSEKKVVLNELYIGLDDPNDVLMETVGSAVFPVGRYHHPVIGWEEDVTSTTRERMLAYYKKHYHPERATLVIVGGVDRARAIGRATELFGAIPRGGTARFEMKEPPPRGETRITLVQDTQVPRLMIAFRSVRTLDPTEPHLDLVSTILAGDKTSRFERLLVDTGVAVEAQCYSDTRRDDGVFVILAQPAPGTTLDALEAAVKQVLADFVKDGPTEAELKVAKAKAVAQQVFSEATSSGLANRLGALAVIGDWRYVVRYPKVIEASTAADVQAAAARVFDPSKAVVGRSVPKAADAEGGGGSGGDGGDGDDDLDDDGGAGGPARAERGATGARRRGNEAAGGGGAGSAIDRALTLVPERKVLANGLRVVVLPRASSPVFHARLAVFDGRLVEEAPGLDALTGGLLEEGTTKRSGDQVALAIGEVGGELSTAAGGVAVKVLSRDATLALSVLAEVATSPAFAADALERVRAQQTAAIDEELDTPRAVAQQRFHAAVYGEGHPMGRSPRGTKASVAALTREQVVAHHAKVWVPRNAALFVVTDLPAADVVARVEAALGGWSGGDAPKVELPALPPRAAATIEVALERAQTNVFLGHLGVTRTDPDYVALEVLDNVFGTGSGFTDRLSKNIRDKAGLAYSVFGNITASAGVVPGTFRIFAGTKPEDSVRARAMMREQLGLLFTSPATPEELEGAKAALRGAMVSACEGSENLLALLAMCERYGLGFDYPRRYLDAVEKVTADDVARVAKAHLFPDALVEVVVGPVRPPAGR